MCCGCREQKVRRPERDRQRKLEGGQGVPERLRDSESIARKTHWNSTQRGETQDLQRAVMFMYVYHMSSGVVGLCYLPVSMARCQQPVAQSLGPLGCGVWVSVLDRGTLKL